MNRHAPQKPMPNSKDITSKQQKSNLSNRQTKNPRHPLQRIASPSRALLSVSPIFHLLGLLSFSASFNYLHTHPNRISSAYGWHFQYLTIIALTLSLLTFTAGLLADLSLSSRLFESKNALAILSTPLNLLVSMLYWGLRAIDPTLVVPKDLELPMLPDLGFHLAPVAFLALDLVFLSPPWTRQRVNWSTALGLSGAFAILYWGWLEVCFRRNGFYPYPLFELLDYSQRVMLFTGCAVVMGSVMVGVRWVGGLVNGELDEGLKQE